MEETHLSALAITFRLALVMLLVGANGFFVAAEFSLVGSRQTHLETLARRGNRRAKIAQYAIHRLDHYISGTQLGITLASLALGWIGETTLAAVLIQWFGALGRPFDLIASHVVAGTIAFALISFLHIVIGELAPKSIALLFPERTSMWLAGPLIIFSRVFTPAIVVLNGAANLLLRTIGLRPPTELERVHRPEEIEMLVRQMGEHNQISPEPVHIIRSALALSHRPVQDVMTPRTSMVALSEDFTIEQACEVILESGHSRVPVYRDSPDHVTGIILARDVWRASRTGERRIGGLLRPVHFVPDSKPIDELIGDMQRRSEHFAVVIDEFGGTAGIVTLEDLVEELVGDLPDEHDEPVIEVQPDGVIRVSGRTALIDLNERFGLSLATSEYTTVGGYVMGILGRIAQPGDEVAFENGTLRVEAMSGRRIESLQLELTKR